jgi:hypothetical protein
VIEVTAVGFPAEVRKSCNRSTASLYACNVREALFSAARWRRNDGSSYKSLGEPASTGATLLDVTVDIRPSGLVSFGSAVHARSVAFPQVNHWPVG